MRILLCHSYYQSRGGEDVSFEQEADLLSQHGHEVYRYVLHNDRLSELPPTRAALVTLWNRQAYQAIRQTIGSVRPHVVHCTNTFPLMSPSVLYAAQREGVAVVQALRNYRLLCAKAQFLRDSRPCELCLSGIAWPAVRYRCYRDSRTATVVAVASQQLHRWLGTWRRKVDLFYTPSEFARGKFIEAGFPPDRVAVKPNFVPRPDVRPTQKRGAVFVGRLSPEKGVETLLEAWRQVKVEDSLTIVGDGPLAGRVRQSAESDQRIRWLGERPNQEVRAIVADAAVLVMPSIWYETFGRAIIEAYSVATPVLASRLGAMAELVDDGVTGRLVSPGDPDALVAAVTDLLRDEARRVALGRAALAEYEANYTPQRNYEQLVEVYDRARMLHEAGGRRRPATTPPSASIGHPVFSQEPDAVRWPPKYDVLGVHVTATDYDQATECLIAAAARHVPAVASFHAVHAVVTASSDPNLREMVNSFEMVGPDGQPVRWALNLLHGTRLRDRVYGPELMIRLCRRAAEEGLPIFLYGATPEVLKALEANLVHRLPALSIVGSYAPPFRPLTDDEREEVNERIHASGARIVFIGLGAPKQDRWAYEHRPRLPVVQVCVGAAFDFHAGVKRSAPRWMQKAGLEWLFRLGQEPRRLWKRYVITNSVFIYRLLWEWLRRTPSRWNRRVIASAEITSRAN